MQSVSHLKRTALLALVFCVGLAQLPLHAQTRRPGRQTRTARTAPQTKVTQPPAPQQGGTRAAVELMQSPKVKAMADAFESSKLPEPARLPAGSVDDQAAELARAVSKGDSSSTPALYAALLASGYSVRERDGAVLQTTERGQGLAFEWWEVAAISKLYGEGYGAGLSHLSDSFTRNVAELRGVALAVELLEGVRRAAQSDHPAQRFWGRFIVELGRHSNEPYDLLGQVDPPRVRLDAVQIALILSRLAADFALAGRPDVGVQLTPPAGPFPKRAGHHADVRFIKAEMRIAARARPSRPQGPCGPNNTQSLILDTNAAVSTTLHSRLSGVQGMNGIRNANIVLTLLKFILSYAMLQSNILVYANPMERTKNTRPGSFNAAAIRVWIDNRAEAVNCMRPFLNSIGLDFDLPTSGPVSGVKVVWAGVLGFDAEGRDWRDDFLDQFTGDRATPADAILTFDFIPGAEQSRATYTNQDGIASIAIVGKPQARDLSRDKLTEVLKVGGVRAWLQLKPTKIEDLTSGLSMAVDAANVVTSFATLDVPSGVAGLITEAAYRLNWFPTKTSYFLVKDWEPCAGAWSGTISVKGEFLETKEGPPGYVSRTEETKNEYEARYTLTAVKDTSEGFQNGYFANSLVTIEDSYVTVEKHQNSGFCDTGRRDARGNKITEKVSGLLTVTNRHERVGAGTGRPTVYIAGQGEGEYNILIKQEQPIQGVRRSVLDYSFPRCPLWERVNSNRDERPETFQLPNIEFLVPSDPKNPGILSGSRTERNARGKGTITYSWNLRKCGG